jgi:hypothetical protein
MASVRLRLEVTPSGVSDGPWAYMAGQGLTFEGNVLEADIPYSPDIQMLMLTFGGNTLNAKVDYSLYLDNRFKKKGTAKIFHGSVGSLNIRFFLKAPE